MHCGSFAHENKFLVCVNIPGNKADSDSIHAFHPTIHSSNYSVCPYIHPFHPIIPSIQSFHQYFYPSCLTIHPYIPYLLSNHSVHPFIHSVQPSHLTILSVHPSIRFIIQSFIHPIHPTILSVHPSIICSSSHSVHPTIFPSIPSVPFVYSAIPSSHLSIHPLILPIHLSHLPGVSTVTVISPHHFWRCNAVGCESYLISVFLKASENLTTGCCTGD